MMAGQRARNARPGSCTSKKCALRRDRDKRKWEGMPRELKKATKNRILMLLAAVISRAMIKGQERSEVQALETRHKRKH